MMPSRFRVRKIFKPVVISIARVFSKAGMTPNQASFVMLLSSLASMVFLLLVPLNVLTTCLFGALVFWTGLMDGVDGAIARMTSTQTKYGGILDSTLDRASDAVIFFAPALRQLLRHDLARSTWLDLQIIYNPIWMWSLLAVIGSYMTSYIRARTTVAGPRLDMDVGLLGRSERLFLFVIGSCLNLIPISLVFIAMLANGTAVYRLLKARSYFKNG